MNKLTSYFMSDRFKEPFFIVVIIVFTVFMFWLMAVEENAYEHEALIAAIEAYRDCEYDHETCLVLALEARP